MHEDTTNAGFDFNLNDYVSFTKRLRNITSLATAGYEELNDSLSLSTKNQSKLKVRAVIPTSNDFKSLVSQLDNEKLQQIKHFPILRTDIRWPTGSRPVSGHQKQPFKVSKSLESKANESEIKFLNDAPTPLAEISPRPPRKDSKGNLFYMRPTSATKSGGYREHPNQPNSSPLNAVPNSSSKDNRKPFRPPSPYSSINNTSKRPMGILKTAVSNNANKKISITKSEIMKPNKPIDIPNKDINRIKIENKSVKINPSMSPKNISTASKNSPKDTKFEEFSKPTSIKNKIRNEILQNRKQNSDSNLGNSKPANNNIISPKRVLSAKIVKQSSIKNNEEKDGTMPVVVPLPTSTFAMRPNSKTLSIDLIKKYPSDLILLDGQAIVHIITSASTSTTTTSTTTNTTKTKTKTAIENNTQVDEKQKKFQDVLDSVYAVLDGVLSTYSIEKKIIINESQSDQLETIEAKTILQSQAVSSSSQDMFEIQLAVNYKDRKMIHILHSMIHSQLYPNPSEVSMICDRILTEMEVPLRIDDMIFHMLPPPTAISAISSSSSNSSGSGKSQRSEVFPSDSSTKHHYDHDLRASSIEKNNNEAVEALNSSSQLEITSTAGTNTIPPIHNITPIKPMSAGETYHTGRKSILSTDSSWDEDSTLAGLNLLHDHAKQHRRSSLSISGDDINSFAVSSVHTPSNKEGDTLHQDFSLSQLENNNPLDESSLDHNQENGQGHENSHEVNNDSHSHRGSISQKTAVVGYNSSQVVPVNDMKESNGVDDKRPARTPPLSPNFSRAASPKSSSTSQNLTPMASTNRSINQITATSATNPAKKITALEIPSPLDSAGSSKEEANFSLFSLVAAGDTSGADFDQMESFEHMMDDFIVSHQPTTTINLDNPFQFQLPTDSEALEQQNSTNTDIQVTSNDLDTKVSSDNTHSHNLMSDNTSAINSHSQNDGRHSINRENKPNNSDSNIDGNVGQNDDSYEADFENEED